MKKLMQFGILLIFSAIIGCSAPFAELERRGLKYSNNNIIIKPVKSNPLIFINPQWNIDNWIYVKGFSSSSNTFKRKSGKKYYKKIDFDLTGNGVYDLQKEYQFELELEHSLTGSKIFLNITPQPKNKTDLSLEAMLYNFIEDLSGNISWHTNSLLNYAFIKENSYATRLLDSNFFECNNFKMMAARIEIANINQLKLNPEHRSQIVSLLLVKIDKFNVHNSSSLSSTGQYPAVMTVLLVANPNCYSQFDEDFETFIKSIFINGKQLISSPGFFFTDKKNNVVQKIKTVPESTEIPPQIKEPIPVDVTEDSIIKIPSSDRP